MFFLIISKFILYWNILSLNKMKKTLINTGIIVVVAFIVLFALTRITSKKNGSKLVIEHELVTSPAILDPKDYPAMLKMETALEQKASRLFLLQAEN